MTTHTPSNRFVSYDLSLHLLRALRPVIERVARSDRDLARQLTRAAQSIVLNIAEGRGRRGKDAAYHFSIAFGSFREVEACLDIVECLGYAEAVAADVRLNLGAALWKLSRE